MKLYPAERKNPSPIGELRKLEGPEGIAVFGNQLYVADSAHRRILRFTKGASTPSLTLDDPGGFPAGVAVATNGTVYVTNPAGQGKHAEGGTIWQYAPDSTRGLPVTPNPGEDEPLYVTCDKAGDLFAAGYKYPGVDEWVIYKLPPEQSPVWQLVNVKSNEYIGGMRMDGTGELVVAFDTPGHKALDVYSPPQYRKVVHSIACPNDGDCVDFNFSQRGDALVVADAKNGVAYRLAYPSGRLLATISKGLSKGDDPVSAADLPGLSP